MTRILDLVRRGVHAFLGAQDRLSYRRLLAWAAGCGFLLGGQITEWAWLTLTGIFISSEAAERILGARPAPPAAPEG